MQIPPLLTWSLNQLHEMNPGMLKEFKCLFDTLNGLHNCPPNFTHYDLNNIIDLTELSWIITFILQY